MNFTKRRMIMNIPSSTKKILRFFIILKKGEYKELSRGDMDSYACMLFGSNHQTKKSYLDTILNLRILEPTNRINIYTINYKRLDKWMEQLKAFYPKLEYEEWFK